MESLKIECKFCTKIISKSNISCHVKICPYNPNKDGTRYKSKTCFICSKEITGQNFSRHLKKCKSDKSKSGVNELKSPTTDFILSLAHGISVENNAPNQTLRTEVIKTKSLKTNCNFCAKQISKSNISYHVKICPSNPDKDSTKYERNVCFKRSEEITSTNFRRYSKTFKLDDSKSGVDELKIPATDFILGLAHDLPAENDATNQTQRIKADDKVSHIPERHELRPTPNPVVAAPEPDPLATRELHPLHTPPELDPLQPPPEGDPLKNDSPISVKWNTYANNMSSIMPSLLEDEKFVDVTLACDGKYIKCHKVILGACSPYFEELLSVNPCQHPIILMRDFYHWEIRAIVDFIYCGFVNIPQHKLPRLLQVANVLQIKGLTGTQDYTESMLNDNNAMPHNDARDIQTPQSNLRKRSELPPESKSSEVPSKRKKTIPSSSRRNSFESRASEEGSIQSEGPHSTGPSSVASISVSLDPPALEQSVLIKEETNFYTDPPDCRYRSDQNMDPGNFTQIGHYQPFASSSSSNFKQEFIEDIDRDPLGFESGVS